MDFLRLKLMPNHSQTFRPGKRCEILLAPGQARDVGDDIFFERSRGRQFGNESLIRFFEFGRIFAGENSCCRIGTMFEGGMTFF
jgi:hypothetical protein